ncbi:hypothetical protein ACR20X_001477 [Providencia stuartii]
MAKNEFLPFGIAEGANVLSNQEYERLAARFNGFVSGVAKSKELNTVWRQSSVMSSALAQFIVDSDNKDLLDNGDVVGVKNRLVAAIKQTISGVGYVTTSAMNLELNKKFDKANISGVLGNDNNKVPSLNLFTTEISKLQPTGYSYSKSESDTKYQQKGNYAPAGDYATNTALKSGLDGKFDKTGGVVSGHVNIKSSYAALALSSSSEDTAIYIDLSAGGKRVGYVGYGSNASNSFVISNIKTGKAVSISDFLYFSGYRVLTTQDTQIPIGASLLWNTSAPIPDNFWPNEGRSFSASEYPELAKVFPSLRLPDDRGYAIRIADNGRGKDPGRIVGTYQDDAMRNLIGELRGVQVKGNAGSSGVFSDKLGVGNSVLNPGPSAVYDFSFNAGNQVPTADEFRMKNVAKILITRVK